MASTPISFASDFSSKFVIQANFERRGWREVPVDGGQWDLCWASVATFRAVFAAEGRQLQPHQLINHFPNHYELTRKDLLARNIKRYQRLARRTGAVVPRCIPSTFVLPQDYALFVEDFRQQQSSCTYILKPSNKAQGKGIFLVNKLSQVHHKAARAAAAATAAAAAATAGPDIPPLFAAAASGSSGSSNGSNSSGGGGPLRPALENYVVSRYIDNPLLLGRKKFDLRLYVLVASFRPLVAYTGPGFCRVCSVKFSREVAQLDNALVHLTNVAVQKKAGGGAYNSTHGNKWPLENLRLHLESTHGHAAATQLFDDVQELVVHTLKAVQQTMIQDNHCFELYGFDVIIDSQLQPWLVEVNASPSLTTTTKADRLLKFQVVNDTLSIVTPPAWNRSGTAAEASSAEGGSRFPATVGSMRLICDESSSAGSSRDDPKAATGQQQQARQPASSAGRAPLPNQQHATRNAHILHG